MRALNNRAAPYSVFYTETRGGLQLVLNRDAAATLKTLRLALSVYMFGPTQGSVRSRRSGKAVGRKAELQLK